MNKNILVIIAVIIVVVVVGAYAYRAIAPTTEGPTGKEDLIRVTSLRTNSRVESPLVAGGVARGNWFFEGSFPIAVLDAQGSEIGGGIAQAQGEWMTTEFVPFTVKINFSTPTTQTGTIVFKKDNPSDMRQFDDELRIPVRFK